MRLLQKLAAKRIGSAEPGELLISGFRKRRTIVLMLVQEPRESLVAVLGSSHHENISPFAYKHRGQNSSAGGLSYGNDWILELVPGPETFPNNSAHWRIPGAVYMAPEGPLIYLPVLEEHPEDGFFFNLADNSISEASDDAATYLRWKIWVPDADRSIHGSEPLVSFVSDRFNP